mgnify:CR=1 FL=1
MQPMRLQRFLARAGVASRRQAEELIKAGKVRALAVTSERRSEYAPDIPTMLESGVPG